MNLGNSIGTIEHHLLIKGMTCLGNWNEFPMVSALEYVNAHYIGPMVNHDVRLSIIMIHQATILHGLSTLRGY